MLPDQMYELRSSRAQFFELFTSYRPFDLVYTLYTSYIVVIPSTRLYLLINIILYNYINHTVILTEIETDLVTNIHYGHTCLLL